MTCGAKGSDTADADRKYTVFRAISVIASFYCDLIRVERGPASPGPNNGEWEKVYVVGIKKDPQFGRTDA